MSDDIKALMDALQAAAQQIAAAAQQPARTEGEYLTTEQTAEYLKVSPREVNREVRRGLPHYRYGKGGMRFKKQDVDRYYAKYRHENDREA